MNITRTLALAAAAAMSLGIGAAMAQESPSMPTADDFSYGLHVTQPPHVIAPLQSGSSDVDAMKPATQSVSPYNYGTLNTPG